MHIDTTYSLAFLLDHLAGCDPEFDDTEELERQFAEIRLSFGNQQ